jgi:hypothetical protein
MIRATGYRTPKPDKRDQEWPLARLGLKAKSPIGKASCAWQTVCVLDQLNLGACVLNADADLIRSEAVKAGEKNPPLVARIFSYLNTLSLAGDAEHGYTDVGCDPRTAVKSFNRYGICDEKLWPYDVARWTKYPRTADRAFRKAIDYARSNRWEFYWILSTGSARVDEVKLALDAGFKVFRGGLIGDDYGTWRPGDKPLDPPIKPAGGHATVLEAYDGDVIDDLGSWGTKLGDNGRVKVSADYIASPMTEVLMVLRKAPVIL